jgi:hypothetical protein
MGLSSSTTTNTSGPSAQALPYITQGSQALQGAYAANQGASQQIGSGLQGAFQNLLQSSQHNPLTGAANTYDTNLLNGQYQQSPQLAGIMADTNNIVGNAVNGQFSLAGQDGSSRQQGELARQLSTADNALQYTDYNNYLQRQQGAASNAVNLGQLGNSTASTLGQLGIQSSTQPYLGAQMLASGLGGLWGNSQTTTQQSNPSFGAVLGSLLQAGSQIASSAAKSGSGG